MENKPLEISQEEQEKADKKNNETTEITAERPEMPGSPETPETPESPDSPETPGSPDSPESLESQDSSESLESQEPSVLPATPDSAEAPDQEASPGASMQKSLPDLSGVLPVSGAADWESKTAKNPFHLTGMVLAYIGDAVYELEIRNLLIARGYFRGNRLHKEATRRVNAPTQSRLVLSMLDSLEPDELEIFRRGRNTKPKYIPKQSNVTEYTNSSGLEALMGYWYLQGNTGRIRETIERLEEMLAEK